MVMSGGLRVRAQVCSKDGFWLLFYTFVLLNVPHCGGIVCDDKKTC